MDRVEPYNGPAPAAACAPPVAPTAHSGPCCLPRAPVSAGNGLRRPPQTRGRGHPLPPPKTALPLVTLEQPSSPWTRVTKPRKLKGFYLPAAADLPAAARPITTIFDNVT